MYSRLKEDEKNHIPYFEIDLFIYSASPSYQSIISVSFSQFQLLAFSTKLILLFVSFLFLSLHQISTIDNMRQFSLHITHSYSDILLLSRFSLRSIIYFDITSRLLLQKNIL